MFISFDNTNPGLTISLPENEPSPRRSSVRLAFFAIFAFIFGATLSFLTAKNPTDTSATLEGFRPGNIMNDYTMGNASTMTEKEIQAWLTAKNPCNNHDYASYQKLTTKYKNHDPNMYSWHWTGDANTGHFVCISEELFGDGLVIGQGETAAHIIYQAAQDYQINPQVFLVLLEKEKSLITDSMPRSGQYQAAVGYACTDTAPCDTRYSGFKNQIRSAAYLFRNSLDGKSKYYPIGNNSIRYSPTAACGSSTVYIENYATSALYRYTPYQPNAAALAAGTGTGDYCSSYGNRNFYHYFTKWFGSTQTEPFSAMGAARVLESKSSAKFVSTETGKQLSTTPGKYLYYTNKTYVDGKLCLMDRQGVKDKQCVLYDDLIDYPKLSTTVKMDVSRYLYIKARATKINLKDGLISKTSANSLELFSKKIEISGQACLVTASGDACYLYDSSVEELTVTAKASAMAQGRVLQPKSGAQAISIKDANKSKVSVPELPAFSSKIYLNGELCLGTDDLLSDKNPWCVLYDDLTEIPTATITKMAIARSLYITDGAIARLPSTGIPESAAKARVVRFAYRSTFLGELCLISEEDYKKSNPVCYMYKDLKEVAEFSRMAIPRNLKIKSGAKYLSTYGTTLSIAADKTKQFFTHRADIDGELCLATESDVSVGRCLPYSNLEEV